MIRQSLSRLAQPRPSRFPNTVPVKFSDASGSNTLGHRNSCCPSFPRAGEKVVPVNSPPSSSEVIERHGALQQTLLPIQKEGTGWLWCLSKQLFPGSRTLSSLMKSGVNDLRTGYHISYTAENAPPNNLKTRP